MGWAGDENGKRGFVPYTGTQKKSGIFLCLLGEAAKEVIF